MSLISVWKSPRCRSGIKSAFLRTIFQFRKPARAAHPQAHHRQIGKGLDAPPVPRGSRAALRALGTALSSEYVRASRKSSSGLGKVNDSREALAFAYDC